MPKINTSLWRETKKLVRFVVEVALIVFVVRSFMFEPFTIPSGSMLPTIRVGDYLFVSKWSYGYSRYSLPFSPPLFEGRLWESVPQRGDIVVFRLPSDTAIDYIKRVVGLPGDRIQVRRGVLHINGEAVWRKEIEGYPLSSQGKVRQFLEAFPGRSDTHTILELYGDQGFRDRTKEYRVPQGHLFVMGDNRDGSQDSRFDQVGFVPLENVIGKAQLVFLSLDPEVHRGNVLRYIFAVRWGRLGTWIHG